MAIILMLTSILTTILKRNLLEPSPIRTNSSARKAPLRANQNPWSQIGDKNFVCPWVRWWVTRFSKTAISKKFKGILVTSSKLNKIRDISIGQLALFTSPFPSLNGAKLLSLILFILLLFVLTLIESRRDERERVTRERGAVSLGRIE